MQQKRNLIKVLRAKPASRLLYGTPPHSACAGIFFRLYCVSIMGLKQNIVIRNQYTVKGADGKGSRGSTPGAYVLRYMARDLATEPIAPIPVQRSIHHITDQYAPDMFAATGGDVAEFITRYMAREDAVEQVQGDDVYVPKRGRSKAKDDDNTSSAASNDDDTPTALQMSTHTPNKVALKQAFYQQRKLSGMAFGNDDVSLSDADLRAQAALIQQLFDEGHTVMKTVVSFKHEYLREQKVVPDDLVVTKYGDYRGNVDQLRLRTALMNGMERMGRMYYDDVRYVGVIQVDTKHVHCHFAFVDAGKGTVMPDGTQRGKMTAPQMQQLRRGVNDSLHSQREMTQLSSAVNYEKRNVASYVRKWAYDHINQESSAQFILACLPDDTTLWRAGSHAKDMRRANALVEDLVMQRLDAPDSPYAAAMDEVHAYADERARREDLSAAQREELVDEGRRRIVDGAINSVYHVLKQVPYVERTVSTEFMDAMAVDTDVLRGRMIAAAVDDKSQQQGVDTYGLGLKFRSYQSRLDHHSEQSRLYREKLRMWEDAYAQGEATDASFVMAQFYEVEAEYHEMATSKYQHFLTSFPDNDRVEQQWDDVAKYGHALIGLQALRNDPSIAKMSDVDEAETLGLQLYGHSGGAYVAMKGDDGRIGKGILDDRIARMQSTYAHMVDEFATRWAGQSLQVEVDTGAYDSRNDDAASVIHLRPGTLPSAAGARDAVQQRLRDERARAHEGVADMHDPATPVVAHIGPSHRFDVCKGVDLHDMGYDSIRDQSVGTDVAVRYNATAKRRAEAARAAESWMRETGQASDIAAELGSAQHDIARMQRTAREVLATRVLQSKLVDRNRRKQRELARRRYLARRALQAEMRASAAQQDAMPDDVDAITPQEARELRQRGKEIMDGSRGVTRTYPLHYRVADQVGRSIDDEVLRQTVMQRRRREGLGG